MVIDKETQDKRTQICNSCDSNKLGVCTKCGCIIKLKVKWKISSCPLGKW